MAEIQKTCKDCGTELNEDDKHGLCDECRAARRAKWKSRFKTGAKIAAGIGAVVGLIFLASKSSDEDSDSFPPLAFDDDSDDTDDTVETDTGASGGKNNRYSAFGGITMKCVNCGNEDPKTLWDEGDTFYCSKCCHRTRIDTNEDDLVECPYCHYMRDRKAMYCRYCNTPWGAEPNSPEEIEELRGIINSLGFPKQ
jgi:hypothetical protein